jgi:hypothetical protein
VKWAAPEKSPDLSHASGSLSSVQSLDNNHPRTEGFVYSKVSYRPWLLGGKQAASWQLPTRELDRQKLEDQGWAAKVKGRASGTAGI